MIQAAREQITQEERERLALQGLEDPVFFCRFFLHSWFSSPMPWVHRGILAILLRRSNFLLNFDEHYGPAELDKIIRHFVWKENPEDPDSPEHPIFELEIADSGEQILHMTLGRNTVILMPRGFSKTTLANAANIIKIVYQLKTFTLYISETGPHAIRQLRNITIQLKHNSRIKAVFGTLKSSDQDKRWSESEGEIQTATDMFIAARGRGGQVRGLNINAQRPDNIVVDDLEDKESVRTAEQRFKAKDFVFSDLDYALPHLDKTSTRTFLGTLLHPEAVLVDLMRDPAYTVVKFGAIDRDGEALWGEAMTLEEIEADKRSKAMKGMLHSHYLELHNEIRAPENQKFKPEFIIHRFHRSDAFVQKAIALDPSISENVATSDWRAFAVVGRLPNGEINVLESVGSKTWTAQEQVRLFFDLIKKYGFTPADKFGVEAVAFQRALVGYIREAMFREKFYFEIEPITHGRQDKGERVEGILQPRYASGYITHSRRFPELETQLLDWPNGKKDFPDALAMAVKLLDDTAYTAGQEDGQSSAEDMYAPLEDVFGGDWKRF